jgi:hypothetical protein
VALERWKHVGDGVFAVSSWGRICRLTATPVKISSHRRFVWYKSVKIIVSHLVYEAFIGPIPEGRNVLHINGDSYDNRPENLRVSLGWSNSPPESLTKDEMDEIRVLQERALYL